MEETPLFPKPEDEEDEDETDAESPKKKLPSLIELLTKEDKSKDKDAKEKPEQPNEEDKTEDAEPNSETPAQPTELAPEDEALIVRSIAEEHLANPVVSETPPQPVTEFLEQVVDGVEPDTAFEATKDAYQLEENTVEADSTTKLESIEPAPSLDTSNNLEQTPISGPISNIGRAAPVIKAEFKPPVSQMASHIATNINLRRSHAPQSSDPNRANKPLSEQQIKPKIIELENKLIKQESALKTLSEAKPNSPNVSPNSMPQERLQPGISESRLNLSKPERAGRIGKMLITNERVAGSERIKPSPSNIKPEQVKTMRRAELLELSSNLKVEGASLKHMFENNLFDEAALRRLVAAHLKGEKVLPLLKREVLVKQSDFERDPRLRQSSTTHVDPLFDKMLGALDKDQPQDYKQASANLPSISLNPVQAPQAKAKPPVMSVANAVLGVVIALLIGLILFFAFR